MGVFTATCPKCGQGYMWFSFTPETVIRGEMCEKCWKEVGNIGIESPKILDKLLEKGYNEGVFSKQQIKFFADNMEEVCPTLENCLQCVNFKEFVEKLIG